MTGTLSASYGSALSTQNTQTDWYDNSVGQVGHADGSELDQAYGYVASGVLHVFLAGDLFSWTDAIQPANLWDNLEVFIDSRSGGQNVLRSDNPNVGDPKSLNALAGLTFDAGFEPDYWFGFHGGGLFSSPPDVAFAYYAELLPGGGGAGYYLGQTIAGGPGTLSGGTNPNGVLVTMNEGNVAGVTAGCGAASGAAVTTGIEWAIPLAAIGNPSGCVRVCAFVDYLGVLVTNQVLGPLPPGTCNLGAPGAVNFASNPGEQFFTVCASSTPARATSWGRLKTIYR